MSDTTFLSNDVIKNKLIIHEIWLLNDHLFGHRASFRDMFLLGWDFSGRNLKHADFRGANLIRTNLSNSDFSYADFRGASLCGADLRGSKFTNAKFEKDFNFRNVIINGGTNV